MINVLTPNVFSLEFCFVSHLYVLVFIGPFVIRSPDWLQKCRRKVWILVIIIIISRLHLVMNTQVLVKVQNWKSSLQFTSPVLGHYHHSLNSEGIIYEHTVQLSNTRV